MHDFSFFYKTQKQIFWRMGTAHSIKYLMFQQKKKVRFDTTWGWVIDDRILVFGWTIPSGSPSVPQAFSVCSQNHSLASKHQKHKPMTSELSWCCVLGGPQLCHCIIEQINKNYLKSLALIFFLKNIIKIQISRYSDLFSVNTWPCIQYFI